MPSFWELIFGSFGLSACAGLAALANSRRPLTTRSVLASISSSGLLGIAIVCGLWRWYGQTEGGVMFLVCVAVIVPLVGIKALDLREVVLDRIKGILRVLFNGNGNGNGKNHERQADEKSPAPGADDERPSDQYPTFCTR